MDVLTRCRGSILNFRESGRKVDNCGKTLLVTLLCSRMFFSELALVPSKPLTLCDLLLAAPYIV